ncbi:hypothetical protein TOPH_08712 [Tolypocladium ophioglossoides CBS 100239]|uniref:Uncharacterized protein n=1 Tax=Tolypocladium ophioglossoides (strain CBS 100239) TaxID=1163406 RepID=A0A0L0MXX7_TOLOC|nr:hypothetical protein TOPH_08712 [Tolypocladium ophioglossoides CBS 100239]
MPTTRFALQRHFVRDSPALEASLWCSKFFTTLLGKYLNVNDIACDRSVTAPLPEVFGEPPAKCAVDQLTSSTPPFQCAPLRASLSKPWNLPLLGTQPRVYRHSSLDQRTNSSRLPSAVRDQADLSDHPPRNIGGDTRTAKQKKGDFIELCPSASIFADVPASPIVPEPRLFVPRRCSPLAALDTTRSV